MRDSEIHAELDRIADDWINGELEQAAVERALGRLWPNHRGIYDHEVWPITVKVHWDEPLPRGKRWRYREESNFKLRTSVIHVWFPKRREGA